MNFFLAMAFLFFVGSILGWGIELVFRRIVHHKWINPGFCIGPYVPIYGKRIDADVCNELCGQPCGHRQSMA